MLVVKIENIGTRNLGANEISFDVSIQDHFTLSIHFEHCYISWDKQQETNSFVCANIKCHFIVVWLFICGCNLTNFVYLSCLFVVLVYTKNSRANWFEHKWIWYIQLCSVHFRSIQFWQEDYRSEHRCTLIDLFATNNKENKL